MFDKSKSAAPPTLFPTPEEYTGSRLFSLDLLRGLDMFYLAILVPCLRPLLTALGAPKELCDFLYDHPWEGFSLYDIIMPLFMFMCGAAIPFALGRRLKNGRMDAAYHRHVWGRVALLWFLGMIVQGNLCSLDPCIISPFNNTLQTIAVGYAVTAYVLPLKSKLFKIALPIVLTAAYGLIVHFGGDYTPQGNATVPVERAVLKFLLPANSRMAVHSMDNGYTWFLPSLIFPVLALAGCYATQILKSARPEWTRAKMLFLFGGASLVSGWILTALGVKTVKHIFSASFTLQAIGWSVLALAALYVLTDIWRIRRGMGLLLLFGRHALTAYLFETTFHATLNMASDRLFSGFKQFLPTGYGAFVTALGYALIATWILTIRRRLQFVQKKGN